MKVNEESPKQVIRQTTTRCLQRKAQYPNLGKRQVNINAHAVGFEVSSVRIQQKCNSEVSVPKKV